MQVLDLLEHVLNLLDQQLRERNIRVTTAWPARLPSVMAISNQIEQVFINLALNAFDAMPQGGTISIETRNIEINAAHARRHVGMEPGSYIMAVVSDTGRGISEETQKHIFEPFFTTKELGKGTGLGLSTVYAIVKQSGLSIEQFLAL